MNAPVPRPSETTPITAGLDQSLPPWPDQCLKTNILLVANGDSPFHDVVASATTQAGRGLRQVLDSRQAFEALGADPCDVDAVVIDLDRGVDSFLLFEAIRDHAGAPPVIALTVMETFSLAAAACRRGAACCMKEPISAQELTRTIENVCTLSHRFWQTSDRWGRCQPRRAWSACHGLRADCASETPDRIGSSILFAAGTPVEV